MLGFVGIVEEDKIEQISSEVDEVNWYSLDEAKDAVLQNSLAHRCVIDAIKRIAKK